MEFYKSYMVANYLRQFPLGRPTSKQRRNVPFVLNPALKTLTRKARAPYFAPNGKYGWRLAKSLEGLNENEELVGCWPANYWRMVTTHGELGAWEKCENLRSLSRKQIEDATHAKHLLYRRLVDADEVIESVDCGLDTRVAFEVGSEWYDPPNGDVIFEKNGWFPISCHSVPIGKYEPENERFIFLNSWGGVWGRQDIVNGVNWKGCGSISKELMDARVVEAWQGFGWGLDLPLEVESGLTEVEWKWQPTLKNQVHVREIRNGKERVAWAFCVRRNGRLDIDEFFVVPKYRRKGFARILANSIKRLVAKLQCAFRLNISFADTEEDRIWGPKTVANIFGVKIIENPTRYVHQIGVEQETARSPASVWPHRPLRPATVLEFLRPRDEPPIEEPKLFKLYFGTNRALKHQNNSIPFADKRGHELELGEVEVCVPKTHKFGSMGRSFIRRWANWTDDRLKVIQVHRLNPDQFAKSAGTLGFEENDHAKHLLFVHGFNVDFKEACLRSAQLGFDLKVKGHTFFYSWPSAGRTLRYFYDEATIEAALPFFVKFMNQLADQLKDEKIDIIAHSMGNRLLTKWLEIKAPKTGPNISGIVFSAADVDSEVFEWRLSDLTQNCTHSTLYASSGDIPVFLSKLLHNHPRAGRLPPITCVDGCDTVEVRGLDLFSLGHSYFGNEAALLQDKYVFFHYEIDASQRQRLVESGSESKRYWILNLDE